MNVLGLPLPVFLNCLEQCDVTTFLNLRLVNRAIRDIIAEYELSLCEALAVNNFRNRVLLVRWEKDIRPSIRWLLRIQHREATSIFLAEKLVEANSRRLKHGVFAIDLHADYFVRSIANGWIVLWHLGTIADEVSGTNSSAIADKTNTHAQLLNHDAIEARILAARTEFILQNLRAEDIVDFYSLDSVMSNMFAVRLGPDADPNTQLTLARRQAWLSWVTLRLGPALFEAIWRSSDSAKGREEAQARVVREWARGTTREHRETESKAATEICMRMMRVALHPGEVDGFRKLDGEAKPEWNLPQDIERAFWAMYTEDMDSRHERWAKFTPEQTLRELYNGLERVAVEPEVQVADNPSMRERIVRWASRKLFSWRWPATQRGSD